MFRQARALAVERGTLKILIDMREMQSKTSFIDSYIFAKNFREKTGIDNSYRLAVVYNSANYPADRADTLQMVGENWGNIAGKMFTSMEAAIRFLRGE